MPRLAHWLDRVEQQTFRLNEHPQLVARMDIRGSGVGNTRVHPEGQRCVEPKNLVTASST
jgi:hypothetical protein